jgi:hypothetical protein
LLQITVAIIIGVTTTTTPTTTTTTTTTNTNFLEELTTLVQLLSTLYVLAEPQHFAPSSCL